MSLHDTWVLMWRWWTMSYFGGMSGAPCFLSCLAWLLTIWAFLVCKSAFVDGPYDKLRSLAYYQQHQLMLSVFLVKVASSSRMSEIVSLHKVHVPFFALGHGACKVGWRIRMSWLLQWCLMLMERRRSLKKVGILLLCNSRDNSKYWPMGYPQWVAYPQYPP